MLRDFARLIETQGQGMFLQRLILFWPLLSFGVGVIGRGYPNVESTEGKIWPQPQVTKQGQEAFIVHPRHFQFKVFEN